MNTNIRKKQLEQVIINSIYDHIIYLRIYEGVGMILNAQDDQDNELKLKFNGISNALILMNIQDEKLIGILRDEFFNTVLDLNNRGCAEELAKSIYVEWLCEATKYFLIDNKTA